MLACTCLAGGEAPMTTQLLHHHDWQCQGHVLAAWDALGRAGEAVLAA